MLEQASATNFFQELEKRYAAIPPDPFRKKAWDHFARLGLPSRKNEAYQYLPFSSFYAGSYRYVPEEGNISEEWLFSHVFPECMDALLIFVNGTFRRDLSRLDGLGQQAVVMTLSDALKGGYGSFLQHRMRQRAEEEKDPMAALNAALYTEGVFVFVPPKVEIAAPIQCMFVNTASGAASFPRVHVSLGARAKASWITSFVSPLAEGNFWSSGVIDLALDEASCLDHILLMDAPKESWGFQAMRATLKKNSSLTCRNFSSGSKSLRQDYHVSLLGEDAQANLKGLSWLTEKEQAHMHVFMDHAAPHTTSHQYFKGVLSKGAQSSFTGRIYVRQKAQKTQAYQLNANLLLTEGAMAYSKPGLEIFADDVKASHGATVSQLDEEQLFYLKTRGLSDGEAKALLLLGFCKDLVDEIPYASIRERALSSLRKYLVDQQT